MTGKVKLNGSTATAAAGYKLDGWYNEEGTRVSTDAALEGYEFNAESGNIYKFTVKIPEDVDTV